MEANFGVVDDDDGEDGRAEKASLLASKSRGEEEGQERSMTVFIIVSKHTAKFTTFSRFAFCFCFSFLFFSQKLV